jgi:hypothetical protein
MDQVKVSIPQSLSLSWSSISRFEIDRKPRGKVEFPQKNAKQPFGITQKFIDDKGSVSRAGVRKDVTGGFHEDMPIFQGGIWKCSKKR